MMVLTPFMPPSNRTMYGFAIGPQVPSTGV